MMKTTNGKPCRPLLCPFAGLIQRETIYANWDMLIGIYEQGKPQHWCGLVGRVKPENRAVFYNIYEGRDLFMGGNQTKLGLEQGTAP